MSHQSPPNTDELPMDFASFVAVRSGLSRDQAQERIGQWLSEYEPLGTVTDCRQQKPARRQPVRGTAVREGEAHDLFPVLARAG